ncbi:glycosyltransferase family 9 protein [Vibrio amylolyticus]|uniref:glycosyltransferase family 9 protein n=1 Tax=Vibrio amylolyticus TaxID=2847292 RepID=UPI00354E1DE2
MSYSYRYQKILVIATHCIGDSLLISVFTRSLREAFPQAQIDVLVNARGEMVFGTNPDVDNLVVMPGRPSVNDYCRLLKENGRYDLVVNEMLNDRTAIYGLVFGKKRIGAIENSHSTAWLKKWVYSQHIEEQNRLEHKMSRAARILSLIGVDAVPHLVSPEEPLPIDLEKSLPKDYLVVHAPSSNSLKQWPVVYWVALIQHLLQEGYHVVLTGAALERDQTIVRDILKELPKSERLHSMLAKLSLAQTSKLIKGSCGFIGPDSGPGHLASGYNIPIVSIISVAPASMWSPWPYEQPIDIHSNLYYNAVKSQRVKNVKLIQSERNCVPCYQNKCAISDDLHSPCLVDIQPKRVLEAVKEMMPLSVKHDC